MVWPPPVPPAQPSLQLTPGSTAPNPTRCQDPPGSRPAPMAASALMLQKQLDLTCSILPLAHHGPSHGHEQTVPLSSQLLRQIATDSKFVSPQNSHVEI